MNPKISIIIPVYNAQDYLERCLESVLNQTFTSFEVILINDGSTDNSATICNEYSQKDERIRVIHQENKGVSCARNRGLDIAKGDYIGFVDPDDYIDLNMYEILVDLLEENNSDISWCGYRRIYKKERYISATTNKVTIFNRMQVLEGYFNKRKPFDNMFLVDKLYKKEIFFNIRLNEKLRIQEDQEVLLRVLNQSNKVVYIDTPFYNYMIRDTGASRNKNLKYYNSILASLKEVYNYTSINLPNFCDDALNIYIEQLFNNVVACIKEGYPLDVYKELRESLFEIWFRIIKNKKTLLKYKIHTLMILNFPNIYRLYIKSRI